MGSVIPFTTTAVLFATQLYLHQQSRKSTGCLSELRKALVLAEGGLHEGTKHAAAYVSGALVLCTLYCDYDLPNLNHDALQEAQDTNSKWGCSPMPRAQVARSHSTGRLHRLHQMQVMKQNFDV